MYCKELEENLSDYECQVIQEKGQVDCETCPYFIPYIMFNRGFYNAEE